MRQRPPRPQYRWYTAEDVFLVRKNFGMVYFKVCLLKADRWVLDVMFDTGLRVTTDLVEGGDFEQAYQNIRSQSISKSDLREKAHQVVRDVLLAWSFGEPFDLSRKPCEEDVIRALLVRIVLDCGMSQVPFDRVEAALLEHYEVKT